jgi:hypothetical protein
MNDGQLNRDLKNLHHRIQQMSMQFELQRNPIRSEDRRYPELTCKFRVHGCCKRIIYHTLSNLDMDIGDSSKRKQSKCDKRVNIFSNN